MIKGDLIIEKQDRFVVVTLNRPQALNALNFPMVLGLHDVLDQYQDDPEIVGMILKGSGGKAFCAGGDIKAAREAAIAMREGRDERGAVDFFTAEYGLNRKLFHYSKPIVALMDGITMGGGVGLASPRRYRIVTPKTVWAMPEVSIGFFPDVGAGYYLTRASGFVGLYLAMTGASLKSPGDLIKCGMANHYIEVSADKCLASVLQSKDENELDAKIKEFSVLPPATQLPYQEIAGAFSGSSVEMILERLMAGGEWARQTAALIQSKSPTSVQVAFRHLKMAETQDFNDIISRDLHLAKKFLLKGDMVEGIRAVLVDKDQKPQWKKVVTEADIDWYFN